MDDKKRFMVSMALMVILIGGMIGIGVTFAMGGESLPAMLVLATIIILAVIYSKHIMREKTRMKEGFPREDERTKGIKERAGYYAYMGSMYYALSLMWVNSIASDFLGVPELRVTFVLASVIVVSFILFLLSWGYFSRKGNP